MQRASFLLPVSSFPFLQPIPPLCSPSHWGTTQLFHTDVGLLSSGHCMPAQIARTDGKPGLVVWLLLSASPQFWAVPLQHRAHLSQRCEISGCGLNQGVHACMQRGPSTLSLTLIPKCPHSSCFNALIPSAPPAPPCSGQKSELRAATQQGEAEAPRQPGVQPTPRVSPQEYTAQRCPKAVQSWGRIEKGFLQGTPMAKAVLEAPCALASRGEVSSVSCPDHTDSTGRR